MSCPANHECNRECPWWDDNNGVCCIFTISKSLQEINHNLSNIADAVWKVRT